MRERENFRESLARLQERFPGREALSAKEVAAMLGCDPRTVRDSKIPRVELSRELRFPVVALARWMS